MSFCVYNFNKLNAKRSCANPNVKIHEILKIWSFTHAVVYVPTKQATWLPSSTTGILNKPENAYMEFLAEFLVVKYMSSEKKFTPNYDGIKDVFVKQCSINFLGPFIECVAAEFIEWGRKQSVCLLNQQDRWYYIYSTK